MHISNLRSCHTRQIVAMTCCCHMSLWQNHIHDTQCHLTLQHVAVTSYLLRWHRMEGPWLVYLPQSCRSNMWHMYVTWGGQMCVQHFVTVACHINSNWFELMWQVTELNCIKTCSTCHTRRLVAAMCHFVWQDRYEFKCGIELNCTVGDLFLGSQSLPTQFKWRIIKLKIFWL